MTTINALLVRTYARLGVFKSRPTRWALALGYTVFITVLLVQSSSQPVVGSPAPPGAPDLRREIELTLAHIVAFSAMVALWWWALRAVLPAPCAMFVTLSFVLAFGIITEIAQIAVADREVSLYDIAINWTVTVATAINLYRVTVRRTVYDLHS